MKMMENREMRKEVINVESRIIGWTIGRYDGQNNVDIYDNDGGTGR